MHAIYPQKTNSNSKMTSRERILTSIKHQEPDRVPVDFGATPSSGISAIAYNNLKKHLGIDPRPTKVYDVVQQLAEPDDLVLEMFNIDVVDIGRAYSSLNSDWHEIKLADSSPAHYPVWFNPELKDDGIWYASDKSGQILAKMPPGATFFDQVYFPYIDGYPENFKDLSHAMSKSMWAAFPVPPWSKVDEDDFWPDLRKKTIQLRDSGRATIIGVGCNLFEWGTFLRRMDNFLMDLILEPDKVEALLDALMENHLETLEKVCYWLGDVADFVKFGDDLGMQNGPFMSPETYRQLFKPRHTQLCDYAKKNSKMHTFLHSCGSIYQLMPDLIEAGFEVINPVQTNTQDMDPVQLKKEFGKDVTFWGGGIETSSVLNNGTTEDVREMVLRRLEIFAPGGGFVFNTIHNILPDVPPENIVAMFDAINEFNGHK